MTDDLSRPVATSPDSEFMGDSTGFEAAVSKG
jgi:hypothetical protein